MGFASSRLSKGDRHACSARLNLHATLRDANYPRVSIVLNRRIPVIEFLQHNVPLVCKISTSIARLDEIILPAICILLACVGVGVKMLLLLLLLLLLLHS